MPQTVVSSLEKWGQKSVSLLERVVYMLKVFGACLPLSWAGAMSILLTRVPIFSMYHSAGQRVSAQKIFVE